MNTNLKTQGLCINCSHLDKCIYCSQMPVIFCEEFQCDSEFNKNDISSFILNNNSIDNDSDTSLSEKGLCKNCDNNNTCSIRLKNVTIWHCEEYV